MKKILLFILSCLVLCSCNEDTKENFEGEIISECSVPQVPLDIKKEELVLVESEVELYRLFEGYTEELPIIDFHKSKLLLIHGTHTKQVKEIKLNGFVKERYDNSYSMLTSVEVEDTDRDCYWTAAYVIPHDFYSPICLFLTISQRFKDCGGRWLYFKK